MSQDFQDNVVILSEQEALWLVERYRQILEKESSVGISPREKAEAVCLEEAMVNQSIRVPIV